MVHAYSPRAEYTLSPHVLAFVVCGAPLPCTRAKVSLRGEWPPSSRQIQTGRQVVVGIRSFGSKIRKFFGAKRFYRNFEGTCVEHVEGSWLDRQHLLG